jgi:hypothetical protein
MRTVLENSLYSLERRVFTQYGATLEDLKSLHRKTREPSLKDLCHRRWRFVLVTRFNPVVSQFL